MKVAKNTSKLVLSMGIAVSSIAIAPLTSGAESFSTTQTTGQPDLFPILFTEANHNQTVVIKKGQPFSIQLSALPFYFGSPHWSLDPINHNVSFLDEIITNPIPGSTGTRTFTFKANTEGTTKIQFRHKTKVAEQSPYVSAPKFWLTIHII